MSILLQNDLAMIVNENNLKPQQSTAISILCHLTAQNIIEHIFTFTKTEVRKLLKCIYANIVKITVTHDK